MSVVIVIACYPIYDKYKYYLIDPGNIYDVPAEISKFIVSEGTQTNDTIYVVNYEPSIYFLSKAKIPSRYCFPPFIIDPHYRPILEFFRTTQFHEFSTILGNLPKMIVYDPFRTWLPLNNQMKTDLTNCLEQRYQKVNTIFNVEIYKLKEN